MSKNTDYEDLEALARRARWLAISTVAGSGAGHVGGPFSAMDLLVALYSSDEHQTGGAAVARADRFILSKGHSSIGQYFVMALRGYLPIEELKTFDKGASRLQGHPDVTKLPGLDTSTGSLGQGLSVGLGFALGARMRGQKFHTFVVMGDGELQEGMIWESLHIAPRYKLGNLTAILDWNGLQQFGWVLAVNEQHAATAGIRGRELICEGYSRSSAGAASRSTGTTTRRSPGPGKREGGRRFRSADDDHCAHDQGQRGALYRGQT